MNYRKALQAIDTIKALDFLKLNHCSRGAYVTIDCDCGQVASVKLYGDKKNLWYCPSCEKAGHIIALVMAKKGLEYEDAKKALLRLSPTTRKITQALNLDYELKYHAFLEQNEIPKEMCDLYNIGVPVGKTMLAGCVAFTVFDEKGTKIAYYGINIKKKKPVFHRSFNPELYLYGYHACKGQKKVFLCDDMIECVRMWCKNQPAICNFGLHYLSTTQLELLNELDHVVAWVNDKDIKTQLMNDVYVWLQFVN